MRKTIDVKCGRCGGKIFRYLKIGKGELRHCWNKRILQDYSIRDGKKVFCSCGNLIGVEERNKIVIK
ncbi:MAG: hypothetical protein U9M95_01290 [Candidatus Altiarchaeota archaeon]|nr:hypothetical protein [Candidatus Altiarchaeota archaeon]